MNRNELPGLYVHVPFCRTKCPYCDFYSIISLSLLPAWLKSLQEEASSYCGRFPLFDSLYLGGGTPSLLDEGQITTLTDALFRLFPFSPGTEMTLEVNPDDITPGKLSLYRDLGFNRISVGAQSFDDRDLVFLKRRHTVRQTERTLDLIRSSGFTNLGIDLMYGFQGQTKESWVRTMERAVSFEPPHLSCYQMTLEEETPFGRMKRESRLKMPDEEEERALFLLTSEFLEAHGYIHYEISNFAREERFYSQHNQKYWKHVPYLGLGPAAHSFQNGVRWWNHRSVERYCHAIAKEETPVEGSESLSAEQLRLESLYLGLRTKHGIDLQDIAEKPGSGRILSRLIRSGLVNVSRDRIIPSRRGFLVADSLPLLFCE